MKIMTVDRLYSVLLVFGTMIAFSFSHTKMKFYVGALVPYYNYDRSPDFFGHKTAIDLAVETIHNKSMLKDYELIVHYKDTFNLPSFAIQSLIEFKDTCRTDKNKVVYVSILGPASSKVASYTAKLSTIWGPLQVSYGASTPELLDKDVYPRFLTVVPTSKSLNKAVIELLKYFKWQRIALAYDVNEKNFFLPTMNALKVTLQSNEFNIVVEEGISLKKRDGKRQLVERLKERDVRIVIALFQGLDTREVMCEAYKQGFHGKKIVWITYMTTSNVFLGDSGCNKIQFDIVSTGMFVLNFLYYRTDNKKTISNLTVEEFKTQMLLRHPMKKVGWRSSLSFDATWLLALTLNASLEDAVALQNSTGTNFELINKIKEKMMTTEFEGISGNITFNDTERLGTVIIRQRRGDELVDVAQHHTLTNMFTFFANQSSPSLLFRASTHLKDGPSHLYQVQHYSPPLFIVIWIVCAVAIFIALGLFHFNFKNREIRYIKMSSPHINNIIIFGGVLCYTKVLLDTLDSRFMGLQMYGKFCNVRVWVMSLGFTTSFGAMFSKTWRVHRIFTASKNFRRAVIKNFHLYGLLLTLLAVDAMLLTLWMIISPYQSDVLELPTQVGNDQVLHPSIYYCTSQYENYFLITTIGYKGLLLVFGIFLAWETRNIEIKALNDSKYIGISVYNVVILSVVGVIIASLMAGTKHYDIYLALMSTVVILCTAATLGIVFIPKIIGLQHVLTTTCNDTLETTYTAKSDETTQSPCCCCENCKCRCSQAGSRKASIHVSNKFLASSSNRRKSRHTSVPTISVTKPKVSVHINARVSLSTSPISECVISESPNESALHNGFLSTN